MGLSSKDSINKRKLFVIGGNARLAKAILNHFSEFNCIVLERAAYQDWSKKESKEKIRSFFEQQISNDSIIFITSGVLNAKESMEIIDRVNYELPWNIIESLEGLTVKIITFGTILENIRNIDNQYVKSKIKLSDKISEFKSNVTKITHFRLHTLYGYDLPSKFMFLGQIFEALKNKKEFEMTSGYQIREYHHLDDVVASIDVLLSNDVEGISEITSGNGIRLRDLGLHLFQSLQLNHLLQIGSLDVEHEDKFSNDYLKNSYLKDVNFRDPRKGVLDYIKSIL